MTFQVLYFGDQSGDFQTCRAQELLHSSGEFDVQLRRPPSDFSDLPHEFPDAFLVDMDLSRAAGNGKPVSYFGSTLAAELRMRNPSCPLFLVTREHVNGLKENLLEERVVVDHVVFKETLIREPEKQRAQMISLIEGFQTLQSVAHEPWHAVLERLGADEEEGPICCEKPVRPSMAYAGLFLRPRDGCAMFLWATLAFFTMNLLQPLD